MPARKAWGLCAIQKICAEAAEREATREERERQQTARRSAYSAAAWENKPRKVGTPETRIPQAPKFRALKRSANLLHSREYNKAYRAANGP